MNKLAIVLVFYSFLSGCTTPHTFEDVTPQLYRPNLEKITDITIDEMGITSSAQIDDSEFKCEEFELTPGEVKTYFKAAMQVSKNDYWHMLDWSPCYIKGKLVFENGEKATWSINQLRSGAITDSNGNNTYLYCPDCVATHFLGP